ncbi:MFS transporter [Paenibacillus sp. N3.4]|uniref:MFS transporter n=1 Tax=Paenibacillus sp. N3.4 TaxID=2603222 RepID=UPI0011C92738|nr:MFS transporter [Paenibacillus sp. N3.4]TXK81854.1 MFS transporter [Paenibacillus sp. N3.4]
MSFIIPNMEPIVNMANTKETMRSRYASIFSQTKAIKAFVAYFLFQTGNFAAFSFFGTWLANDFSLSVQQLGTAMLILGLGNTIGSLSGSYLVRKFGIKVSLSLGLLILAACYVVLPFAAQLTMVEIHFLVIFFIGGVVFPIMLSLLQSLSVTARGTIAALSNAAMYGGTTIGGFAGGALYAAFSGFQAVSLFTSLLFIISLFVFVGSGIMNQQVEKERSIAK